MTSSSSLACSVSAMQLMQFETEVPRTRVLAWQYFCQARSRCCGMPSTSLDATATRCSPGSPPSWKSAPPARSPSSAASLPASCSCGCSVSSSSDMKLSSLRESSKSSSPGTVSSMAVPSFSRASFSPHTTSSMRLLTIGMLSCSAWRLLRSTHSWRLTHGSSAGASMPPSLSAVVVCSNLRMVLGWACCDSSCSSMCLSRRALFRPAMQSSSRLSA
mmetsp:Transcript_13977/g.36123  ORF Transcript_13977/g.36123 Transcript_13977/m.36123 type:complete len:217 (+) Transcript_13977:211-861(+)